MSKSNLVFVLTSAYYNSCDWCCSDCKPKGEYLQVNEVLKTYIDNSYNVTFTGGEALLHPSFEKILSYVDKKQDVVLITSGMNPNVKSKIKQLYYDNLEKLFIEKSKGNHLTIEFSYSEGVMPKKRLEDFLTKSKEFNETHQLKFNPFKKLFNKNYKFNYEVDKSLGFIYYRIATEKNSEEKLESLREIGEKILGKNIFVGLDYSVTSNGRKGIIIPTSKHKCGVRGDEVIIKPNGDLSICCSVEAELGKLKPYANIFENSFDEVMGLKKEYLSKLRSFQTENDDSCQTCITGFNNYLK